ncbi:unnamed protein product [Mortierella alpina]
MEHNASLSGKGITKPRRRRRVITPEEAGGIASCDLVQPIDNELRTSILGMLNSGADVVHTLSKLSLEQLSSMEALIQQAKRAAQELSRAKEMEGNLKAPTLDTAAQDSPTGSIQQYMTAFGSAPRKTSPSTVPSIEYVDGVPWLTFGYSTKSFSETYTVRVDVDTVTVECIPLEAQQANCIYPSANGPEHEYRGTRRSYERECNVQGWKLAHLNPSILDRRKGVLQRAVVSLRNATLEQKSRRAKRQENALRSDVQSQCNRGPVMAIPKVRSFRAVQTDDRQLGGGLERTRRFTTIQWQPLVITSSQSQTHAQLSHRGHTVSNLQTASSEPVQDNQEPSTNQARRSQLSNEGDSIHQHRLPILGVFKAAHAPLDSSSYLDFDGYIKGKFRTSRIRTDVEHVRVDRLTLRFREENCVYPRSFSANEQEPSSWNTVGIRQAEECYLNDIGWKLCALNEKLLSGRRLLLQQALNAYRRHYLPATCQPRARIGPSLLTRRHSASSGAAIDSARSDRHRSRQRSKHSRVRFDLGVEPQSASTGSLSMHAAGFDTDSSTEDTALHGDEETAESEGSEDTEEVTSEDESDDGSSSDDVFHSQMSLLSFTGNIRTYSLGTGSGSARSRPRLDPVESQARSHSPPLTSITRKRPLVETQAEQAELIRSHNQKRMRHGRTEIGEAAVDPETTEQQVSERDEGQREEVATQSYDEDEDDWWMSRLNNSEYPEDHNFISMTTEELIGALTSGYNSDIGDEDDDAGSEFDQVDLSSE